MLQTPCSSSAMDVTMESFSHDVDEPFNADFSAIEPSPTATAWNVTTSAFGGHSGRSPGTAMDISCVAQPGTPAKAGGGRFSYDSMYGDINLGDKMGEVLRERSGPSQRRAPALSSGMAVEKRSAAPPLSPYSRRRPQRKSAITAAAVDPVALTATGVCRSSFGADLMERSIALYRKLKIDGLIANWAQDMKWVLDSRCILSSHFLICWTVPGTFGILKIDCIF